MALTSVDFPPLHHYSPTPVQQLPHWSGQLTLSQGGNFLLPLSLAFPVRTIITNSYRKNEISCIWHEEYLYRKANIPQFEVSHLDNFVPLRFVCVNTVLIILHFSMLQK